MNDRWLFHQQAKWQPAGRQWLREQRHGLTLLELLVILLVIGVLLGLLLPVIQSARESSRRERCSARLRDLGMGVEQYRLAEQRFPAGVVDEGGGPIRSEPTGQHIGWLVSILPFIAQQALYEEFDWQAGVYAASNAQVRATVVPTMICPSYPGGLSIQSTAQVPIDSDSPETLDARLSQHVAISSYAGCHHDQEAPIDDDNHGTLFLNSKVRLSEIPDGSSQTILLGEAIPDRDSLGWVSGTRATLRNTGAFELVEDWWEMTASKPPKSALYVGHFGSFHPDGANFVFADASTKFITNTIDSALFQQLGNRGEKKIEPPPAQTPSSTSLR